jgi:hypothetical protein
MFETFDVLIKSLAAAEPSATSNEKLRARAFASTSMLKTVD